MMSIDNAPLSNTLGFLALGAYIATLLPTLMRIIFPKTKQTGIPQLLLKYRRTIGILAFIFTLGHAYFLIQKRNLDFLDIKTSWIYIQGVSTFTILMLLTITSNNWSMKLLKKNWKKLHSLTYIAMFLLTWHVWDKMLGHWTCLTPLSMIMIVSINIFYIVRRWIEYKNQQQKAQGKVAAVKSAEKTPI